MVQNGNMLTSVMPGVIQSQDDLSSFSLYEVQKSKQASVENGMTCYNMT